MNACSKVGAAPMQRTGLWSHVDAIMTSANPIKRYGDSAKYDCPNCKGKFRMTLTEQGLYENAQMVTPEAKEVLPDTVEVPVPEA